MLKVDIQHFANTGSSAKFVETTLSNFKLKLESQRDSENYPNNDTVYFVSTNYTNGTSFGCPYLLYKGDQMIGNSSMLEVRSNNGIGTFTNDIIVNAKYRYKLVEDTSIEEIDRRFIYHVYADELTDKQHYLNFTDSSKFDENLKTLLSNIKVYHTYVYTNELGKDSTITDTYVVNPDEINDISIAEDLVVENLEESLTKTKLYLNKVNEFNGDIIYTPIGRIFKLNNVESINDSTYLFSINFASYLDAIDGNYLDRISEKSKFSLSGIHSIDIRRIKDESFRLDISSNPSLKYIYSEGDCCTEYVISEETKTGENYNLIALKDYDSIKNALIYGKHASNSETVYIYEIVSEKYSNLFRDFTENYSSIKNVYLVNVTNSTQLSTAIPGIAGQMLFVIDEFTDRDGKLASGTNLYYWKESTYSEPAHWHNANMLYTSRIKLSDNLTLTDEEIRKLKGLLA